MNQNNPNQDWEPVIIRRPKTKADKSNVEVVPKASASHPNKKLPNLNKTVLHDFDPENVSKPPTADTNLKQAIQAARMAKKKPDGSTMTQADLDKACQFPKNTVRDYENGTAVVVSQQITKMNQVLGVKLPRQK